ncbi:MAG: hypothetical protein Q9160_005085 [Pyrenula sp. 1 TL-2023]
MLTSSPGFSTSSLVEGYPWSSLPEGSIVVDVGGSEGHASLAIAEVNPHLRLIVQDLPQVVKGAPGSQDPSSLDKSRMAFMEHDFLTPQEQIADVYLLRRVLHGWSDSNAIKILRNLIPALRPGARIVVNDQVMPAPGSVPFLKEKQIRYEIFLPTRHLRSEARGSMMVRRDFDDS